MKVINAQSIPQAKMSSEDVLARFCYHYQQYTYTAAQELPYKRIVHMLKIAEKEKARELLVMASISAAPHSKNGSGVKKVVKYLNKIIQS